MPSRSSLHSVCCLAHRLSPVRSLVHRLSRYATSLDVTSGCRRDGSGRAEHRDVEALSDVLEVDVQSHADPEVAEVAADDVRHHARDLRQGRRPRRHRAPSVRMAEDRSGGLPTTCRASRPRSPPATNGVPTASGAEGPWVVVDLVALGTVDDQEPALCRRVPPRLRCVVRGRHVETGCHRYRSGRILWVGWASGSAAASGDSGTLMGLLPRGSRRHYRDPLTANTSVPTESRGLLTTLAQIGHAADELPRRPQLQS